MSPVRSLAGLALVLTALVAPATAQSVDSIQEDTATAGDVIRVFGTDLEKKTKVVLVQDGEVVKKTKLKVLGAGVAEGEGGGAFLDLIVKKAFPGVFQIGIKDKKDAVGVSEDSIELVPPTPESVAPDIASPKDEVVVMVRDYGDFAHKAYVGDKKTKIVDEQPEGLDGLTAVTIKVPNVPDGNWPVSIANRMGKGTLKNALEVTGSTKSVGNSSAQVEFIGIKKKPFKAKKKSIATDEQPGDPGEVNVGAVGGSKKRPVVLGISLPGQLDDLVAGDEFMIEDGASILYSETNKDGSQCVWTSAANEEGEEIAVQLVTIDEESMVLFVCGKLRLAEEVSSGDCGPEVLCISGMITAPSTEDDTPVAGECSPLTTATGSMTGEFVSSPERNEALYGLAGPNVLLLSSGSAAETGDGTPLQVIEMRVTFNPATDATPATFDSLALDGSGLQGFSLVLADATAWTQTFAPQVPPTPSSMSVTITEVEEAGPNPFGILGCLHGTFTGTMTYTAIPEMPVQTFSGEFEIPWYDPGFGQ